jgi:hypothetical protein
MAAPRKLPDNTTLRQLRAQGWKLKQIAQAYDVKEAAVWKALERAGFTDKAETYRDIIPWDIDPRHRSTAIAQRFRSIQRQRQGKPLNETEQHLLDTWLQVMKDNNVVLDYHPDAPPNDASRLGGFFYTPRLPQDEWIVRVPPSEVERLAKELEEDPSKPVASKKGRKGREVLEGEDGPLVPKAEQTAKLDQADIHAAFHMVTSGLELAKQA